MMESKRHQPRLSWLATEGILELPIRPAAYTIPYLGALCTTHNERIEAAFCTRVLFLEGLEGLSTMCPLIIPSHAKMRHAYTYPKATGH